MPRLIDADALLEKAWDADTRVGYVQVVDVGDIEEAPTIEAEPVKHGEPLTLEELRQMHGEPVWIEQENAWGIVNVNAHGQWNGIPFVLFFYESVRCEWDIESRGLTCYHHKPEKHGRWVWGENAMNWGLGGWTCSECQEMNDNIPAKPDIHPSGWIGSAYCPNCGTRMGGGYDE